jgi:SPP1 family predicted phage head-tail adaptor
MIRAGKLRHLVTIQQLVTGSPQELPNGEPDTSWGTYATVYAEIKPIIGTEFDAAGQTQSKEDTDIRMRYEVGVNDQIVSHMRILHGETIYNIERALNMEMRNREWLLKCSTGVNEG